MQHHWTFYVAVPPQVAFDVIADLERYHEWLEPSAAYQRTELLDTPIREGARYVDIGSAGRMRGAVTRFDPPLEIACEQRMRVGPRALGWGVVIGGRYVLTPKGEGTEITRHYFLRASLPLRPFVRFQRRGILHENSRIVELLGRRIEEQAKR